ncbi:MAG: carboxylesterase family protein [Pararhodobacter sp.]|nr:carboxylesterase family protein [Pararhodobacter sp.]
MSEKSHFARGGATTPRGAVLRREGWRGQLLDGVECWYGLRYGRLTDPANPRAALASCSGQIAVEDLTEVPVFPQLPSRLESLMGPGIRDNPQHREAFFLNVWAPAGAESLPVLVFLHGGAWASGGGSARWYRGAQLAEERVVVVTLNYRLGPAGHFADKPDDGLHRPMGDLLAALHWVQDRIAGFGGDPARVTLAGQSAGAWYVWALAGYVPARGLFDRAALLSAPKITPWTRAERLAITGNAERYATALIQSGTVAAQAELQAGARALSERPHRPGNIPPMYLPTLPHGLGQVDTARHVSAVYTRTTTHEMSVFLPPRFTPEQEVAILADLRESTPTDLPIAHGTLGRSAAHTEIVARATWKGFGCFAAEVGKAVQGRYTLVQRGFAALSGGADSLGATHCLDLPFQFGNREDWHDAPMLNDWDPVQFETLSRQLRKDIADFVKGYAQASWVRHGEGFGPIEKQDLA